MLSSWSERAKAIFGELRDAEGPLSNRDIAREVALRGEDAQDRQVPCRPYEGVSKALRPCVRMGMFGLGRMIRGM